jgi:Fur family ferric uptake transcriptional regulator
MQDHESKFNAFLEKNKLRFTQPRRLILDKVFELHEHFDIEQLYDLIHKVSAEVSRATVYRTIPLLTQAGLIQRSVRGETRDTYEHIYGHPLHAHWLCKSCGAVIETDIQDFLKLVKSKSQAQNFDVTDINLTINGLCWKCQNNDNESQ